jgi:hypothetical protein
VGGDASRARRVRRRRLHRPEEHRGVESTTGSDEGLLAALRPSAIWADVSTIEPFETTIATDAEDVGWSPT